MTKVPPGTVPAAGLDAAAPVGAAGEAAATGLPAAATGLGAAAAGEAAGTAAAAVGFGASVGFAGVAGWLDEHAASPSEAPASISRRRRRPIVGLIWSSTSH